MTQETKGEKTKIVKGGFRATLALVISIIALILAVMAYNSVGRGVDLNDQIKDLQGKTVWERHMIARRRKTLVLCKKCHVDLHAGRLSGAKKRLRENRRAGYA